MKRYIYITVGIVAAAAVAILVLYLIKGKNARPSLVSSSTPIGSLPSTGTQGKNSGNTIGTLGLPVVPSGTVISGGAGSTTVQKFGVLSDNPVADYFIDPRNNITAIEPTGEVFTVSNGKSAMLTSSTIDNIISASFSYDGKKIVVSYGDPSAPHAGIFDVAKNVWVALPQGMLSPQWSPTNNYQIAYLVMTNAGKLALATVDAANLKASPVTLFTLNATDVSLQWPTKSEFILSDKPTLQSVGSVWSFNSQAGTLTPVVYQVLGAESTWSRNAAIPYGLVFFNNAGQNILQLQSLAGSASPQPLTLQTLPSKCAFNTELMPIATSTAVVATTSSSTSKQKKAATAKAVPTSTPYLALYCGIPRSSSDLSSAHLPDDYNMMKVFSSDDLYKINTTTGELQSLWSDATQNVDASDMKFANNALFFVNRYDSRLYGLTFSG